MPSKFKNMDYAWTFISSTFFDDYLTFVQYKTKLVITPNCEQIAIQQEDVFGKNLNTMYIVCD